MKRGPLLLFILLTALNASACIIRDAELRIRNRTASEIWVSVDDAEPRKISEWANWSKFFQETRQVSVSWIGNFVFPQTEKLKIRSGLLSSLEIKPSGGAIILNNDGSKPLLEVYLSPSEDLDWGSNKLGGTISEGQNALWTLTEGFWDIKLVDSQHQEFFKYRMNVALNQGSDLNFSDFGKAWEESQEPSPWEKLSNKPVTNIEIKDMP